MSESNQSGVKVTQNAIVGRYRIRNNRIIAKVDGVNTVLSSAEFERLKRDGYSLEAVGSECETGA